MVTLAERKALEIFNDLAIKEGIAPKQTETQKIVLSKFSPRPFSEEILKANKLFTDRNKRLYLFDQESGLWIEEADTYIEAMLRQGLMGEEAQKSYYVREVIEDLKGLTFDPKTPDFPEPDRNLIPFQNGVYDLETKEFMHFEPEMFFTSKLPVKYNPQAKCPTIECIFRDIVNNPTDLYELIGYCLYRYYPYQKFFFLFGSGGNGKSLFLSILRAVIGSENISSTNTDGLQKDKFASAGLHRKLVAIAGESSYSILRNTETIKQLTGGDKVRAERKWGHPFSFVNYAKLIIATNELPATTDKTSAFYRRLYLIEFPNKITGTDKEVKGLIHKIDPVEFEGLAFKALQHLVGFIERGFYFKNDQAEDALRDRYERLTNPLRVFIDEFCEEDANGYIPKWIFRDAFNRWQRLKGEREWNDTRIGTAMKDMGYDAAQKTVSPGKTLNTLNRVNTLFLTVVKTYRKSLKNPVNPVNPVNESRAWRCWLGLKFREIQHNTPDSLDISSLQAENDDLPLEMTI